uniref:Chitin-binding type-2 domain-containing protein n=1 Tax=Lygus hesperus TaxID=30085 RepID=A0A146L8P7_LYGHE
MKFLLAPFVAACVLSVSLARIRVLASLDIPVTSFSCAGRPIGYYADVENNCQTYHMCGEKGEMYSYACPNTTLFHQRMLICAHWYQVNCNRSADDYSANLLIGQRDKPFVDDIAANDLNGISSESFRKAALLGGREGKSVGDKGPVQPNQPSEQDLVEASSGSFVLDRHNTITARYPDYNDVRSVVTHQFNSAQASAPFRSTSTEPTGAVFRPTNVSFRSTIETPNSEAVLARTAPMASAQPLSRTESAFRSPDLITTVAPDRPSLELLPPLDGSLDDTNTIELHLHDHRHDHYISSNGHPPPLDEPIVVSINLSGKSRFRPASPFARVEAPKSCPRCHPMFVIDKTNCSPCLLIMS